MPRDVYIFIAILLALIGYRYLLRGVEIRPGVAFFLFSILVVAQIVFLLTGFLRRRRPPGSS